MSAFTETLRGLIERATGDSADIKVYTASIQLIVLLHKNREAIAELVEAAQKYLAAEEAEAKAKASWENARDNFTDAGEQENKAYSAAITKAALARQELVAALAKLEEQP